MILYLNDTYYEEAPGEAEVYKDKAGSSAAVLELPDTYTSYERMELFYIGTDGDVVINGTGLMIQIAGQQARLIGGPEGERVYWNQRILKDREITVRRGDCILIGKVKIIFYPNCIQIYADARDYSTILNPVEIKSLPFDGFPDYKRSPRIIKRVPSAKIELKSPPENEAADKGGLAMLILPSLATSAVTVGVGLMMGRGSYLLMSVGVTGVTMVVSIIRFFSEKKERREKNLKNREAYEAYLLKKRKEIYKLYLDEQESYNYNFPDIFKLNAMVHSFDSRIYERLATDQDFLVFSVGKRYGASAFSISLPEAGISAREDGMYKEAADLKKEFGTIQSAAAVDLKRSHLGLVGSKAIVHQQLQIYLCQLAVFHSYRDLQMIAIYDDKYGADFKWMEWLPHCKISALNVRGLVHSEKSRDQILNSLNQILKERQQKLEESKKEAKFLPHFLFVIDEPNYIMDHSIMEFLSGDSSNLGFSLIYTSYLRANLPDYIGTVLLLEHAREGTLLLKERVFCNETIRLPEGGGVNLELFARDLGALNHLLGTTSHIPESITFFEMYKVLNPEELDIEKRWKSHCAEKSLGVPLGVRAVDDTVELNLHEKAHGPHGLVAGTTGSGKSEIIQSYILSLAVNFHPHEVGFLLIDYKGGGMAGLFEKLPHLLGTITNLDGSESMRALASIKSELSRRQKIFSRNHVNHINGYMGLFREGKVSEPIPHLFLISDEFAELKKEQPEFMKELVSTARIGRSLGVHLILATQKPSGVVDDQIWTNSKFKLALKVQNESDSKEILKTPDAASITQAGRAYLQVGNNEIYELFQSAWSGALYLKEQEKEVTLDDRVYRVNDLGQRMLINQDLGGSKAEKSSKETQLDATIAYIQALYRRQEARAVSRPWLPALKPVLVSPWGHGHRDESGFIEKGIEISLGLVDIPEEQSQKDYTISFTEDGNLMYIASGGFGKSVLLTTIAISIAARYQVWEANLFVLDFGNNGLIALGNLPHTAEYITLDDTERYQKFKKCLSKEIKVRKKQLAQAMAQNYQVYNQTSEGAMCAWVILIDNFDAVRELGFEDEEYFTRASRDGMSLGIYFAITATRMNAIRSATFNNFKNKIAGFNFERGEVLNIVGRSPYTLPEIKGRAMIKYGERVSCMQIYTMVPFNNSLEYRSNINTLINDIREGCNGHEAPHMPIMPEEVTLEVMEGFQNREIDLYVGLDKEEVTLEGIRMTDSPLVILGAAGSGKTNLLKVFLHQLTGKAEITVFDSAGRELRACESMKGVSLIKNLDEFVSFMDRLETEVVKREQQIKGCAAQEEERALREMDKQAILIDDLSVFFSRQTTSEEEIADMLFRAANVGILIAATNIVSKFYGSDPVSEMFKRSGNGVLVSPQGHLGAAPVDLEPGANEGTLYRKGRKAVVRIPKA
ncbi:MAG: type VII secretion protein EssC [Clostridium sp.]|nr:type VII secretion protein EssC [Clostridium sp.]